MQYGRVCLLCFSSSLLQRIWIFVKYRRKKNDDKGVDVHEICRQEWGLKTVRALWSHQWVLLSRGAGAQRHTSPCRCCPHLHPSDFAWQPSTAHPFSEGGWCLVAMRSCSGKQLPWLELVWKPLCAPTRAAMAGCVAENGWCHSFPSPVPKTFAPFPTPTPQVCHCFSVSLLVLTTVHSISRICDKYKH